MAKDSAKTLLDGSDRLQRIAFWYWEYMRRNKLYKRYCAVIEAYNDYFKDIGIYESMQTREFLNEMAEYVSSHDDKEDLKYTPFRRRLEKSHGKAAGLIFFKYGFLSCGFENNFGRIYKNNSIGLSSDKAFEDILKDSNVEFATRDPADLSALLKLNGEWLLTVDEMTPDNFSFDFQRTGNIKINPQGVVMSPSKVGLEIQALNIINKAVESLFKKQNIEGETLQAVYKLCLEGKHINSSDVMRLAMVWLWDKAHEASESTSASFDDVYPLLKAKVEESGKTDGAWEQIVTRRKRIQGYYEVTDFCIKNRVIMSLTQ
jgi:hypothetical protein